MHEEYTPPSPIELKPRHTKPPEYDQECSDKFGDEGLEPVDIEEEKEDKDFDPCAERQMRIQDDIATAERKSRAGKLSPAAKKNIKIERKTAPLVVNSAPKQPAAKPVANLAPAPKPEPEPKKVSENLDLDDLGDLED